MNSVLKIFSRLALALTILPAILFLFDLVSLETAKQLMIVGGVLWFATSPLLQNQAANAIDHPENQDNL